jgi:hypothetical protein
MDTAEQLETVMPFILDESKVDLLNAVILANGSLPKTTKVGNSYRVEAFRYPRHAIPCVRNHLGLDMLQVRRRLVPDSNNPRKFTVKRIADILLSVAVDDSEIVVSLNDYHQARNKVPVFHMHLCHYTIFEFYTSNAYPQGIDIVVGYISDEAIKIDKDKLVAGVTIRDDYFEYKAGCATFRPGSSWRNAPL